MNKHITLEQALAPNAVSVWVINKTNLNRRIKTLGELHLTVFLENGQKEPLKISPTWLPENIANQVPIKYLRDSIDLRKAYNNGLIGFVSPEYAEVLLNQNGSEEERERLDEMERQIDEAATAKTLSQTPVKIHMADRTPGYEEDEDDQVQERKSKSVIKTKNMGDHVERPEENGLDDDFRAWLRSTENLDEVAMLGALRMRGQFSRKELIHMAGRAHIRRMPRIIASIKAKANRTK